jgi:hypothetical protein
MIPSWLDPWWHVDYEMSTALSHDAARTKLTVRSGRLRGRASSDGSLALVRRGGFLNGFVRARVELNPDGPGTRMRVRIARPKAASVLLSVAFAFLFFGVLVEIIDRAARYGMTAAVNWLPFLIIGPAIWAAVIGANYTSARSETKELRRLINEAIEGAS